MILQPVSPMVYLDHWALRRFSSEPALGSRLTGALRASSGTLAVSWMNLGEYATVAPELRPEGETKPGMTKKEERRLADLDELLVDLEEFAAKLRAVVQRTNDRGETVGYDPDLDDGVVLNAAPLHEAIPWPRKKRHRGRSVSELAVYWEELAEGRYDWAHLAMRYWPTRVTEKCRTDRSLALAHGLDGQFFPGLREELRRQTEAARDSVPVDGGELPDDAESAEDDEGEE